MPESSPLQLFAIVAAGHRLTAWRDINPKYADTLRLAITSKMEFGPEDFTRIVRGYGGKHWLGPDMEGWYSEAVREGSESCIVSLETYLGRTPFMLDGERVHVGKVLKWEGMTWKCASIEAEFVRVKRHEWERGADGRGVQLPETLREIPRAGFEQKIAAEKAAAKAERAAEREAMRADPVELLPFDKHLLLECGMFGRDRYGYRAHIPEHVRESVKTYGTDYKKMWTEYSDGFRLGEWLVWIGYCKKDPRTYDADALRKRCPWSKVEQQLFRFVRKCRGLPLRDEVTQ